MAVNGSNYKPSRSMFLRSMSLHNMPPVKRRVTAQQTQSYSISGAQFHYHYFVQHVNHAGQLERRHGYCTPRGAHLEWPSCRVYAPWNSLPDCRRCAGQHRIHVANARSLTWHRPGKQCRSGAERWQLNANDAWRRCISACYHAQMVQ